MNQINKQKLISISKIIRTILPIFFIVVILMAIIPWIFPTTEIGKFLLSLQGFSAVINATHKNINEVMLDMTPLSQILGFIGSVITLFPLFIGTLIMLKVSKNYSNGKVFILENAKAYRLLGIISLIDAILLQPLYQMFFYACVTINNPVGHRVIAFAYGVASLTAIFFAIVLIVIGHVMTLGQKISEEQDLTI